MLISRLKLSSYPFSAFPTRPVLCIPHSGPESVPVFCIPHSGAESVPFCRIPQARHRLDADGMLAIRRKPMGKRSLLLTRRAADLVVEETATGAYDYVLDFGAHRGKQLKEVPVSYLCWMTRALKGKEAARIAERVLSERGTGPSNQGKPESRTILLTELKECSSSGDLERGRSIHRAAARSGDDANVFVASTLIDMYVKCGSIDEARRVFDSMKYPNVVSWTALILGYAANGQGHTALQLLSRMILLGCLPDARTFVAALVGCTDAATKEAAGRGPREWGHALHALSWASDCDSNTFVANALVGMYSKCGRVDYARRVFDFMSRPTVVSWTALIFGYADNGEAHTALHLFWEMIRAGYAPDPRTYVAAVKSCTDLAVQEEVSGKLVKAASLEKGRAVHLFAQKHGCMLNTYLGNTLVDMYAKCGIMEEAQKVFDDMNCPEVTSWNALILGYVDNGEAELALDMFLRMRLHGCEPNARTLVAALKACGMRGALELGKEIHADFGHCSFEQDAVLGNSLVDFYGRCGSLAEAERVFDSLLTRDVITWNSLLSGYSSHGDASSVFRLFSRMQDHGIKPDAITLQCILTACSHAGLVDEGTNYFETMTTKYGVQPDVDHYTCMIDILGRANKLDAAMELLRKMPFPATAVTWLTVLGACRKWKNVELGRLAFKSLLDLDDKNPAAYVLMANIYASRGMWKQQEEVQATRKELKVWKRPGQSWWTDQRGTVHTFLVQGH